MTITREQIVELLASNVGCDCDISFGEVVGIEETAEAIQALIEVERDPLVDELVALFKWSDTSYLHALLHVKNAVLNERATASARIGELEKELQDEREKTGKYRNAMAKIPLVVRQRKHPMGHRLAIIQDIAITAIDNELSPPAPAA